MDRIAQVASWANTARFGVFVLALADLLVLWSLSEVSDWQAAEYTWNHSIFDLICLAIARLCVVFAICCCARFSNRLVIWGCGLMLLGMTVVGIVKICTSDILHGRSVRIHSAVFIALVCPFVEFCALFIGSCLEKSKNRKLREEMENDVDELGMPLIPASAPESRGKRVSLRRLFALAWPERYLIVAGITCLLISTSTQLIIPTLFGDIVGAISSDEGKEELQKIVLTLIMVFVISSVFATFRGALFNLAGERLVARFRIRVFEAVIQQDISFFDETLSGELQSRLSNDTTKIQDACTTNISVGLRWLAQIIVGIIILFVQSPRLTCVMLSVVPAVSLLIFFLGKRLRKLSKEYQAALAHGGEVASQSFGLIRTVRSFSKESHEIRKYSTRIMEAYSKGASMAWAYGIILGTITLSVYMAITLVLWYGGSLVMENDSGMDGKTLSSFLLYTVLIAVAVGGLSSLYSQLVAAVGASERMFEIIDRVPSIPIDRLPLNEEDSQAVDYFNISAVQGEVRLEKVSFTYPSRPSVQVLNRISLTCLPGTVNALVGESGGGKSTVINLLQRFYDPTEGSILIDGQDIRQLNTIMLHSIVGVVSQMPVMFAMSIKDNIEYGVHHPVSDKELTEAARDANALSFIEKLPQKFDALVGEQGVTLSGGERQRIAIARALLSRPKILLLDEATSALDSTNEALVQEALSHAMQGKTSIVIAHRLSTVRMADAISVIANGRIVEQGTHDELMKKMGQYASLVKRQLY